MKDLKEIVKRLDSLSTELYNKFGSDSYLLRCDLHDIKSDLLKIDFISSCEKLSDCVIHSTDWNGKCFNCGKQVFVREEKQ